MSYEFSKPKITICFIINPWDTLKPEIDSTLRLIHESAIRGHTVGILDPHDLTIRQSKTYGIIHKIIKQDKYSNNFKIFHKKIRFTSSLLPISGFDVIFIRHNPPLDLTMLNFLDSLKEDTFIINNIDGLRKANNKLYPASFDDPKNEIIPVTHVSKNKNFLKKAILDCQKDKMILKPLEGYGGSGVIVVETRAKQNINSLLDFYISGKHGKNYIILQEYVEGVELGDTRILMLNGNPIGAYKRIPAEDDVRANITVGASAQKHTLTKKEKFICKKIKNRLIIDGLYFVGIDIISGKLIEINVISPGGISKINQFNRTKLQKKVIDFVEKVISQKETAILRKRKLRQIIDEA